MPRLVFSDLPLGNAAGLPHDTASQDLTLELGLQPAGDGHRSAHHAAQPVALAGRRRLARRLPEPGPLDAAGVERARQAHEQALATARSLRQP